MIISLLGYVAAACSFYEDTPCMAAKKITEGGSMMFEFKKEMEGNSREKGIVCECCGPLEEKECGCGEYISMDKEVKSPGIEIPSSCGCSGSC
ncbi:MAG: hypothetical protein ABSG94_13045 [Brevinematales bacterium]|jgi:hypothetical protein